MGLADLDNDGDVDLALASDVIVLFENVGGKFVERHRETFPFDGRFISLHFVDLDRNGLLDVMARGREMALLRSQGGWNFKESATESDLNNPMRMTWSIATIYHDQDTWPDLVVTADTDVDDPNLGAPVKPGQGDALYRHKGLGSDGTLQFVATPTFPASNEMRSTMGVVVGDFNHDGYFDLYLSNIGRNPLFLRSGDGQFREAANDFGIDATRRNVPECVGRSGRRCLISSWSAALEDFDHDGIDDLIVANGAAASPAPVSQFRGTASKYEPVEAGLGCLAAKSMVSADLDNDGDLDLVMTNDAAPARLYRNEAPAGRGWLRVALQGTTSNRQGVGSVVTAVFADGRRQIKAVGAGGLVLGWNPAEAHFVAGSGTITRLEVQWASGNTSAVPVESMNTRLVVTEP